MKTGCFDLQLEVEVEVNQKGEVTEVYSNAVSIKNALKRSQILWLQQEMQDDSDHECDADAEVESGLCSRCKDHSGFCSICGMSQCCGASERSFG